MTTPSASRPSSRLLFRVGKLQLALESRCVVEVVLHVPLQRSVASPAALAGFFDYRGTWLPVVDLNSLLLGMPCPAERAARIAVVEIKSGGRRRQVGLLAEGFTRLLDHDAPEHGAIEVPGHPYVGGWVRDGAANVQLVVAERLLGEEWLDRLLASAQTDAAKAATSATGGAS